MPHHWNVAWLCVGGVSRAHHEVTHPRGIAEQCGPKQTWRVEGDAIMYGELLKKKKRQEEEGKEKREHKQWICAQLKLSHNLFWWFCMVPTCTTATKHVTGHASAYGSLFTVGSGLNPYWPCWEGSASTFQFRYTVLCLWELNAKETKCTESSMSYPKCTQYNKYGERILCKLKDAYLGQKLKGIPMEGHSPQISRSGAQGGARATSPLQSGLRCNAWCIQWHKSYCFLKWQGMLWSSTWNAVMCYGVQILHLDFHVEKADANSDSMVLATTLWFCRRLSFSWDQRRQGVLGIMLGAFASRTQPWWESWFLVGKNAKVRLLWLLRLFPECALLVSVVTLFNSLLSFVSTSCTVFSDILETVSLQYIAFTLVHITAGCTLRHVKHYTFRPLAWTTET